MTRCCHSNLLWTSDSDSWRKTGIPDGLSLKTLHRHNNNKLCSVSLHVCVDFCVSSAQRSHIVNRDKTMKTLSSDMHHLLQLTQLTPWPVRRGLGWGGGDDDTC